MVLQQYNHYNSVGQNGFYNSTLYGTIGTNDTTPNIVLETIAGLRLQNDLTEAVDIDRLDGVINVLCADKPQSVFDRR